MPQTLVLRCHNSFQDQGPSQSLQEFLVVLCLFLLFFSEYDGQSLDQFAHVLHSC